MPLQRFEIKGTKKLKVDPREQKNTPTIIPSTTAVWQTLAVPGNFAPSYTTTISIRINLGGHRYPILL